MLLQALVFGYLPSLAARFLRSQSLRIAIGGDEGIRTLDPLLAGQVLSQLSYTPVKGPSYLWEILKDSLCACIFFLLQFLLHVMFEP